MYFNVFIQINLSIVVTFDLNQYFRFITTNVMKKTVHVLFTLLFCSLLSATAQVGGSWLPARADTSFPRSIIHSWEVPDVKASLASGKNIDVYTNLYNHALKAIPDSNSSISDRGIRAAIAKNAAFVYLIGLKPSGNSAINLTPTEKTFFKNKAIGLLNQTNTYIYPITPDSPLNWDYWQYISKYMIEELEAYDFLRGGGVARSEVDTAKRILQTFVGNLYLQGSLGVAGANFFQTAKNNHSLMTASAIGLGAVILNDVVDSLQRYQPEAWINCAMWNIHNVLWWDVRKLSDTKKDAGYSEGTYYFKYAFLNVLPFIRSMGYFMPDTSVYYTFQDIHRKLRNPWFDTNYVRIYKWYTDIRCPDGRMPPIEDSYVYKHFPELCILRNPNYLPPMYYSHLDSSQDNSLDKQMTSNVDMRADYVAANLTPTPRIDSTFIAYPDAGVAVFRSGSDSAATYMAVLGKNGSALASTESHNQADDASFMMMVNGEFMALDPGYGRYELRVSLSNAENHNMILVDGKATDFGFPGKSNGSQTYIEKYFKTPVQNYTEARTSYQNANIFRKFMHVRNKYFLVVDHMASVNTDPHQFSMLLHGYGSNTIDSIINGNFYDMTANKHAAWKRKQSGLYAYTNSDQAISMTTKTGIHEHTYGVLQPHTYTSTSNNVPTKEMSFMTILQPFKNMNTDTFPVTTLNVSGALGYKVVDGNTIDIAVSKSFDNSIAVDKTTTGLSQDYNTDARFFFSSETSGSVKELFVNKATFLVKNNDTLFTADRPFNIEYLSNGSKSIRGFAGDVGYVNFHLPEYAYQVLGEGVWTTSWDSINKISTVYFGKASSFIINYDNAKTGVKPVESVESNQITVYPNPATDITLVSLERMAPAGPSVEMYDISGKLIRQDSFKANTLVHQIETSSLESGIYLIMFKDNSGNASKPVKLLVTH